MPYGILVENTSEFILNPGSSHYTHRGWSYKLGAPISPLAHSHFWGQEGGGLTDRLTKGPLEPKFEALW